MLMLDISTIFFFFTLNFAGFIQKIWWFIVSNFIEDEN